MIKKLLIFLVLLVGGFAVLYSVVGESDPAAATSKKGANGGNTKDPGRTDHPAPGAGTVPTGTSDPQRPIRRNNGPGITVPTKGDTNSTVEFQPGGEIRFRNTRRIKLPDREIDVLTYQLHAKDSRAESGNRLALEDVTIEFFETDEADPTREPRKTSVVTASRALVELTRDEETVLIDEDKLMQFWDLVYREGRDLDRPDTKIVIGHAQAINTPDTIHVWTADETELVRVESNGPDGLVVTGRGLDAWIPSIRNEAGEVELKPVGIKDIKILGSPALVRGRTSLRSKGPLHLREDSRTATLHLTMTDAVELTSIQSGRQSTDVLRMLTATGDRLDAHLARLDKNAPEAFHWRRIELVGAPARLADRADLELRCASLVLLPDVRGEPAWITATGRGELAPVVTHRVEGHTNTYRSGGDVHVIRIGRQHDFFLNSFGIVGGVPTEFDQLIVFEGRAILDSPRDKLHVASAEGLTLLRSELPELKHYAMLRGRGAIEVSSTRVRATGNQGFVLRQYPVVTDKGSKTAKDENIAIVRHVQLGPAQADPNHRYEVRRLPDPSAKPGSDEGRGLYLSGSGLCKLRLRDEVPVEVHLSSLAEDIAIAVDNDQGRLRQVRTLDAWFGASGQPSALAAKGRECLLSMMTEDGLLEGKASEIHNPATDTYRLVGNLAEASRTKFGRLRGRDILIERLSKEDVRMRASHQAELHVVADPKAHPDLKQFVDLDIHADEIRLEPFLVPPVTREFHDNLLPAFGRAVPTRYVIATGNVDFRYTVQMESRTSSGEGKGDALRLRTDRAGEQFFDGRLLGKPATIVSTDEQGHKTSADSHIVVFGRDKDGERIRLERVPGHQPVLRLLELPEDSGVPTRLALTTDGSIDMEPGKITCRGPVTVRGLDELGKVDADGYRLDARSMRMRRAAGGEITNVLAEGDVKFRWADADGTCETLEIDMLQSLIIARGKTQPAVVHIPLGTSRVAQLNYNFRTKMVWIWRGRGLTRR